MRVLVVHHNPDGEITGAASMARSTAAGLAARGHSVVLQERCPGDTGVPRPGVPLWHGRETPAGWRPEIVHLVDLVDPECGRAARAAAWAAGCPLVVTPATDLRLWQDREGGMEIARSADVVLTLTDEEGRRLQAGGVTASRLAKIAQGPVLPDGGDPGRFRQRLAARGPLVLFLGRKLVTKGYQHLLAAAPSVLGRHPLALFAFAGPDPDGTAGRLIAAVGDVRVIDLGVLSEGDKHSALLAADILCLPSVVDAFPMVITEAWWCRTAVVTSPFPGAREVVRDGIDGRIVDAEPAALAGALNELLDDPQLLSTMAAAGQRRAQRQLRWDGIVEDIEVSYRRAQRGRGGGRGGGQGGGGHSGLPVAELAMDTSVAEA
jgi:glycosyltransferase involved in cell wall biosynthesis